MLISYLGAQSHPRPGGGAANQFSPRSLVRNVHGSARWQGGCGCGEASRALEDPPTPLRWQPRPWASQGAWFSSRRPCTRRCQAHQSPLLRRQVGTPRTIPHCSCPRGSHLCLSSTRPGSGPGAATSALRPRLQPVPGARGNDPRQLGLPSSIAATAAPSGMLRDPHAGSRRKSLPASSPPPPSGALYLGIGATVRRIIGSPDPRRHLGRSLNRAFMGAQAPTHLAPRPV
ncbi:hypothetical protein NDU88_002513 [Pleurodeles waltl]|uniref:Uncharacterized protein n=1 Tax=Pleurodeles waltl TaxID=8319 RepID=A0AAV7MN09_PLEWA|nr:hypothetical protein NDU88_002513 [Pleurodeles waltl]